MIGVAWAKRPWLLEDSIGFSYFVRDQASGWFARSVSESPIVYSPDGSRFFVIVRRGDLACDCNVSRLLIFSVNDIKRAMRAGEKTESERPREVELQTASKFVPIRDVRWVDDGAAVAFLGASGSESPQIYRMDAVSGVVTKLTSVPDHIHAFDVSGNSTVYVAQVEVPSPDPLITYPAAVVGPFDMGRDFGIRSDVALQMFASYKGGEARPVGEGYIGRPASRGIWMSPDGRYAVIARDVLAAEAPLGWSRYGTGNILNREGRTYRRYDLIDVVEGMVNPAVQAPTGVTQDTLFPIHHPMKALWFPGGDRVLLFNSMLPLDISDDLDTPYVVQLTLRGMRVDRVSPMWRDGQDWRNSRIEDVSWMEPGVRFRVTYRGTTSSEFSLEDGVWQTYTAHAQYDSDSHPRDVPRAVDAGVQITVEENENSSPRLVARSGSASIVLLDPNPGLSDVQWASAHLVRWRDSADREWIGTIVVPDEASVDRPVPLVVQASNDLPGAFLPDGPATTAFASQALAARGFAVLTIQIRQVAGHGTASEGPSFVDGVDAAVLAIARAWPIDVKRVGIVGFSRGGALVGYAMTHPGKIRFSAAISADSADPSYLQYLFFNVASEGAVSRVSEYESWHGGGEFWSNKDAWIERAPGFNLEKVQAPWMIAMNGRHNLLPSMELFAGLRRLGKRVEMLMFPEGAHQLIRPRERFASMSATSDWMAFWILGYEDPTPSKGEQYLRWRDMRESQPATSNLFP